MCTCERTSSKSVMPGMGSTSIKEEPQEISPLPVNHQDAEELITADCLELKPRGWGMYKSLAFATSCQFPHPFSTSGGDAGNQRRESSAEAGDVRKAPVASRMPSWWMGPTPSMPKAAPSHTRHSRTQLLSAQPSHRPATV
ncbi:uncharacterized protein LOC135376009 [Ornithodoros turicata]|uniref:uncharacterized protein LOC135376009 n=1 Tax=Ornithodoros turicata TaxID=34597 RepID=UPI003139D689